MTLTSPKQDEATQAALDLELLIKEARRKSRVRRLRWSGTLGLVVLLVSLPFAFLGGSSVPSIKHNSGRSIGNVAGSRSCLETKLMTSGNVSLRYPACWSLSRYITDSTMSTALGYLSNEPMRNPCSSATSGVLTIDHCGVPIRTLKRGGVLVTLFLGIGSGSGNHVVLSQRSGRESVAKHPPGALRATEEISISIDADMPGRYYELNAYFRGPGIVEDQRQLKKMLDSMKIK